jgi:hypothetical protein
MHVGYAFLAVYSLSLIQRTGANIFYLKDQWRGNDFFQGWNWETENDPTHGRVNYVSQDEAIYRNLACGTYISPLSTHRSSRPTPITIEADGDKFILRADDWSIVKASARGRDSVRISSQTAYAEAVLVLDVAHMPAGCATWPAFWTNSQAGPWPAGGEIDIIEGTHPSHQSLAHIIPPPKRRCQLERAKPSHSAHPSKLYYAPSWSWPAADGVCLHFYVHTRGPQFLSIPPLFFII